MKSKTCCVAVQGRKMFHKFLTPCCLIVACVLSFSTARADDKFEIYTVNYPLQYFAQRIGGQHVNVKFPAPADVDPAFWMPDVKIIGDYQQADLILLNGAGYAKWVSKVSLPRRKLVNTSSIFKDDYIKIDSEITHQHGPAGDHSHAGIAFTTWLDFTQASRQAEKIAAAMKNARPGLAEEFEQNFKQLNHDLMQLDARMSELSSLQPAQPLLASHPVYQYLSRRYELNLKSLMWEPGVYPEPAEWQVLNLILRRHEAEWMLWEDQPIEKTQKQLSASGVDVVVFSPCMNRPQKGDFMTVMQANIDALANVFSD